MNKIEKTKKYCLNILGKKNNHICKYLPGHIASVEKWACKIMKGYPKASRKICLLSVWLHDIGHSLSHKKHHIESEKEVRRFLKTIKINSEKIEKVAHCVRAHRCRDVMPKTIEAKILAAADSASHFTDGAYMDMLVHGYKKFVSEKIERDYRDVGLFPNLKKELTPLYNAWKTLLKAYPN
jgi:HD superfamily phosphodiesterase